MMKRLLLASTALAAAGAATAQETPESNAAGPAQGLPELTWEFANGATLQLYGQINLGVLHYDDGVESETYAPVDNDNASTRFGLRSATPLGGEWTLETTFEAEYAPRSSATLNVENQSEGDWALDDDNIRKLDLAFEHPRFGTFSLGEGSMASDGAAEADLSGTDVVANSEVNDVAGGQLFRLENGALADLVVENAFTNYDGFSRKTRVRYDTPQFLDGFQVSASYGQEVLGEDDEDDYYDVAAGYEREGETLEIAAALAYGRREGETEIDVLTGSASVLHAPTGLNVTVAAGRQDDRTEDLEGTFGYGKLGLVREYVGWGETAVSVDYYAGSEIASPDSESDSIGVAVVQSVDAINTDLWFTWRRYGHEDDEADYEDGEALFAGAIFEF